MIYMIPFVNLGVGEMGFICFSKITLRRGIFIHVIFHMLNLRNTKLGTIGNIDPYVLLKEKCRTHFNNYEKNK